MLNRKYTHFQANGIYFPVIHCFTKEPHESDNNFTRFAVFAVQITQASLFAP